jgi:hypothetical protein
MLRQTVGQSVSQSVLVALLARYKLPFDTYGTGSCEVPFLKRTCLPFVRVKVDMIQQCVCVYGVCRACVSLVKLHHILPCPHYLTLQQQSSYLNCRNWPLVRCLVQYRECLRVHNRLLMQSRQRPKGKYVQTVLLLHHIYRTHRV